MASMNAGLAAQSFHRKFDSLAMTLLITDGR
jgi:hypothetical protein